MIPPEGKKEGRKLSEQILALERLFAGHPVTLWALITALESEAYLVTIILLTLPFLTPLPLVGLSTPFGFVIALLALQLAWGAKSWLPGVLRNRAVPKGFVARVVRVAAKIIRWLESVLRTRWGWVFALPGVLRVHALLIVVAAAVLLLPLPIPLTNTFPAWVILLAACGLLERDGVMVVLAYVVAVAGVFYFVLLGEAAHHSFRYLLGHLWN